MLINQLQKLQWTAALTVIVLAAPSHAQSALPPPLKPNEVILKTKDGCGFVQVNPVNPVHPVVAANLSKTFSDLTWGGACIDGLAMGEGRVSDGQYNGFWPTRGWAWYGRQFGASVTRSEFKFGPSTITFIWNDESISYNTLSTSKPVWKDKVFDNAEASYVNDMNSSVRTVTLPCIHKEKIFPECRNDPLKFNIYFVVVTSAKESVEYMCPDPRSAQGCEALWAQHAGPVIERIKAFVAENEPKAEARKREIAPLLATWRPSPQRRQDEAASDAEKRAAHLTKHAEDSAKWDQDIRKNREDVRIMKEQAVEIAAAEKAQAERSAKDRREALGILVGAIGQYQQQKTNQRQAQQVEQQRQLQAQQAQQQEQQRRVQDQQNSAYVAEAARAEDPSRSRKIHNPAADARSCTQLIQDTTRQGAEISGRFRFVNKCPTAVEFFWCSDAECMRGSGGNTWTIHVGGGWPVSGTDVRWGACRGANSGGFDKGSQGLRYTCPNLKW